MHILSSSQFIEDLKQTINQLNEQLHQRQTTIDHLTNQLEQSQKSHDEILQEKVDEVRND